MMLTRNQFMGLLFILLVCPVPVYRLIWLARSVKTTGTMYFVGHGDLGSALGISTYPVIRILYRGDSVEVHGNMNVPLKPGEQIGLRYLPDDPASARIDTPACLWGDTIPYVFFPFLVLLVIYITPERFDPLIPRSAKVRIGGKSIIRLTADG